MKKRERRAYSRDERKEQVLNSFLVNAQAGHGDEMTIADIARYLQVTASGKLREIVGELVINGDVMVRVERIETGGAVPFKRWYSLPDGSIYRQTPQARERQSRAIKFTHRGRSQQMEMKF